MKAGDIVTIYEDPLTKKKPEGQARLIECKDDCNSVHGDEVMQFWLVRFLEDADDMIVHRWVLSPHRTDRFQRGSGCYTCRACKKKTRHVGNQDATSEKLCVACFEYSGWENSHNDGQHEELGADPNCPICRGDPCPW